jgi:hypothetical protein
MFNTVCDCKTAKPRRSRKLAQADATTHNHELNLHILARRMRSIHNKPGSLSAGSYSQQQPEYQLAGTAAPGAAAAELRGWKASRAITDLCTWLPGSPPAAAQYASQARCGKGCVFATAELPRGVAEETAAAAPDH